MVHQGQQTVCVSAHLSVAPQLAAWGRRRCQSSGDPLQHTGPLRRSFAAPSVSYSGLARGGNAAMLQQLRGKEVVSMCVGEDREVCGEMSCRWRLVMMKSQRGSGGEEAWWSERKRRINPSHLHCWWWSFMIYLRSHLSWLDVIFLFFLTKVSIWINVLFVSHDAVTHLSVRCKVS